MAMRQLFIYMTNKETAKNDSCVLINKNHFQMNQWHKSERKILYFQWKAKNYLHSLMVSMQFLHKNKERNESKLINITVSAFKTSV